MQSVLEQQKSNIVQFPKAFTPAANSGGGGGDLTTVVKDLISSIKKLTGAIVGQTKVQLQLVPKISKPELPKVPEVMGGKPGFLMTAEDKIRERASRIEPTASMDKVEKNKEDSGLNSSLESSVEDERFRDKQLGLLIKIEENTRGGGEKSLAEKEPKPGDGFGLGTIGTIIAVAAGTLAGLVSAWVKTVKFFVSGFANGIKYLGEVFPKLGKIVTAIETTFMSWVNGIKGVFSSVVGKFASMFEAAVGFFKGIFGEGSMIGKVITSIKTAVTGFLEPIMAGFRTIGEASGPIGKAMSFVKNAVSNFMGFFSGIGTQLGTFGKLFSAVSGVVSKIAYPLMIIMSVWDTVKGALAGWEEGGFVGAIGGAIKGLFNGLVFGVLDMIKGGISWIAGALGFKKVEEFLDSFSFADMFSAFVDAVLFIPKKIQEFIMSPIETMKKLGETVMGLWEPIKQLMGTLADALMFIPNQLFGLINDYIVTPLTEVFKPVADFFKGIAEQVMGFFEDFGIPEMGFSVLGKKISIGPWYPFRPDQGSNRVGGNTELTQSDSASGGTSNFNQNVITSGAEGRVNKETGETYYREDQTRVLTQSEKVGKNGDYSIQQNFATFDPRTGKAMLEGDAAGVSGSREISTRAFRQIKANAQKGGDSDKLTEIVKEDDAYQKLSFWDKRKVDVGYAKASDLLAASSPAETPTAQRVSQQSADNSAAKMAPPPAQSTSVVNAPVTNTNNTSNNVIKAPIRNRESTQTRYLENRYA